VKKRPGPLVPPPVQDQAEKVHERWGGEKEGMEGSSERLMAALNIRVDRGGGIGVTSWRGKKGGIGENTLCS